MLKLTIITVTIVGILVYMGFYGYKRLLSLSLAANTNNFSQLTGSTASTMTLSDCAPGPIPFWPSFNATFIVEPRVVQIKPGTDVRITNGDSSPHAIGLVGTEISKTIEPGATVKVDTSNLPPTGKWLLTCDGVNLGDSAPSIQHPGF